MRWQAGRFELDLSTPVIMGIVNLTADSFSDGGQCLDPRAALKQAERLVREGASLLDLGAESSRPGAEPVSAAQEWARLEPVLTEAARWGIPLSVDTCKPEVMQRALAAGADVINDIHGFQAPGALETLAQSASVGACVMHMRGNPQTMQQLTAYDDVVREVHDFLATRIQALTAAGIDSERIALDPGFGFAKTPQQNLTLARALPQLAQLGRPLLIGWSRKSTLGWLTGRPVAERLPASLAAALAAVAGGAKILRVHDVGATVDALRVWAALAPTAR